MSEIGIHAEAELELEAAFEYLEEERPGHGLQLLERYRAQVGQIIQYPSSGTPVLGYAKEHDVRKFHLAQFSYALVVATVAGRRTIVAVTHHKRREDYWRERLE